MHFALFDGNILSRKIMPQKSEKFKHVFLAGLHFYLLGTADMCMFPVPSFF